MKHNHGIRVTLRDYWSDKLTEYPNPYQKRHVQYQGAFGSRLVTLHSDQQFQVHVTFDDHFELTTADGVLVVIAAGSEAEFPSKNWNPNKTGSRTVALSQRDHRQSYWIDAQNLNSQRTFMFSFLRLWELDIDNPRQDEIKWRMPQPDSLPDRASDHWMSPHRDVYSANDGCIAVTLVCGRLTGKEDEKRTFAWIDPPRLTRDEKVVGPKTIRADWFRPVGTKDGLPYTFEYRNMIKERLRNVKPSEDGNIGDHPAKKSVQDADELKEKQTGSSHESKSVPLSRKRKSGEELPPQEKKTQVNGPSEEPISISNQHEARVRRMQPRVSPCPEEDGVSSPAEASMPERNVNHVWKQSQAQPNAAALQPKVQSAPIARNTSKHNAHVSSIRAQHRPNAEESCGSNGTSLKPTPARQQSSSMHNADVPFDCRARLATKTEDEEDEDELNDQLEANRLRQEAYKCELEAIELRRKKRAMQRRSC